MKNWTSTPASAAIAGDRLWFFRPEPGREHPGAESVLQQERKQSERVGLRPRYSSAGGTQPLLAGLPGARHLAGKRQEQVRLPVQHPEQLLLSVRDQHADRARSRQRPAFPAAASHRSRLDVAGDQQAPARGHGDSPHRAVGRHGSVDARPRHDFGSGPGSWCVSAGHDLSIGRDVQQQHQHDLPLGAQGVGYHRRPCSQGRHAWGATTHHIHAVTGPPF